MEELEHRKISYYWSFLSLPFPSPDLATSWFLLTYLKDLQPIGNVWANLALITCPGKRDNQQLIPQADGSLANRFHSPSSLATSWQTECSCCLKERVEMEWQAANKIHLKQMSTTLSPETPKTYWPCKWNIGLLPYEETFQCPTRRANGKTGKETRPPKKSLSLQSPRTAGSLGHIRRYRSCCITSAVLTLHSLQWTVVAPV